MLSTNLPGRLCLLSLLLSGSFAAPYNVVKDTGLVARANDGSSKSSPIEATFDITGWEDIAEQNCYAMLCLDDAERVWQKTASTTGKSHYVQSGAYMTPFRKDHTAQRHTEEINTQAGDDTETNSAEEFPWESMAQGGTGAYLAPATKAQQGAQSNAIRNGFRAVDPIVSENKWFRITFTGNLGKMCTALMSDPPDTSVCDDPEVDIYGKTGVHIANFFWVAQRLSKGVIFTHAAGPNKGKVGKRMSPIEMRAAQENDFSSVATGNEGFDNDQSIPIESRDTDIEFEDWDNEDWEASDEESFPIESRDVDIEDLGEDWDDEDWEALNEGFE